MQSRLSFSLHGHLSCPFQALAQRDFEVSTTAFEDSVVPDVKNNILPSPSVLFSVCGQNVNAVAYGAVRLSVRIVSTSVARTHFWSVAASDIASRSTVCFPAITHANISTIHFSDGASRIPTQVSFMLSSARTRSLTSAYNCAYVFLTVVPPSSYKSATLSG